MDRKRTPTPHRRLHWIIPIVVVIAAAVGYLMSRTPQLVVERDRLTITTVTNDRFFEYVNLTGRVESGTTYFIDSKVSGNVEEIFVRSGDRVRRGDTLLRLSNADLELEVMQREGQLLEQLTTQRQTRLLIDQNDFTRREQLTEIRYALALQEQQYTRDARLFDEGVIARSELEPSENRYAYFRDRQQLLGAAYRQDSLRRAGQLRQIDASEARLLTNLRQVRAILDRLYVTAATDGTLSSFSVQAGQAIAAGDRLGEIYRLDDPVIAAEVDEFYLPRVSEGQRGRLISGWDTLALAVRRIYPTVENSRFRLDAALVDSLGTEDRFTRGQSVRLRLEFGRPQPSVLLASGNFYGSTGGHWVYRLEEGQAVRTPVRLGRSNPDYYEVLEGLRPGDRVITSTYDGLTDYSTLKLKG